jgi:hypothetical protein
MPLRVHAGKGVDCTFGERVAIVGECVSMLADNVIGFVDIGENIPHPCDDILVTGQLTEVDPVKIVFVVVLEDSDVFHGCLAAAGWSCFQFLLAASEYQSSLEPQIHTEFAANCT